MIGSCEWPKQPLTDPDHGDVIEETEEMTA